MSTTSATNIMYALTMILFSRPTSGCRTIGGGDPGASCAFPFIYRDVEYRG